MMGSQTLAPEASITRRTGLGLFAVLALLTLTTAWFINERVFTREVVHQLLDSRLDASRVDAQFDLLRQVELWGYLTSPLLLLLRLTLVALTVQLFLLLSEDVPFRAVFRATAYAQLAICAAGVARAIYLFVLPSAEISRGTLSVIPGSLASVLMYPEDFQRPLYGVLSLMNLFELAWCVVLFVGLRQVARVAPRVAFVATAGVWGLLAALQWSVGWYVSAAS
jgi:hypothetical protein